MQDKINSHSIDVILTSPPYNMTNRKGGISDTGRYDVYVDWMSEKQYIDFSVKLFENFDDILVKNGVVLYNLSYSKENPTLPFIVVSEIYNNTDFELVDTIVWKKKSAIPSPADKRHLTRRVEYVFVFVRKSERDTFNIYTEVSKVGNNGQTYYKTYDNLIEARNNDKPTPKLNQATYSTDLCKQLLSLYSKEDDLVYDPFMGTGTTAKACVEFNRRYIGSEISKAQVDYAVNRVNNFKN